MRERSRVFQRLSVGVTLLVGLTACTTGTDRSAEKVKAEPQVVANLQEVCTVDFMQTVVDGLSPELTIKALPNGTGVQGTKFFPPRGPIPAFCQASGTFVTNAKTGKTAGFLATFPASWNGKYLQMGCSGHCGQFAVSDPAMPFSTITNQGLPFDTIRKGYASFATDEGHTGLKAGSWAIEGPGKVNQDAIEDFYYRAQKTLTKAGKAFTTSFYAKAVNKPVDIAYSYFNGCSGGGRDALVAASYYPEEFDGIIAGSAYNLGPIAFHSTGIALAQLRSKDASLSEKQVAALDGFVMQECDTKDGVKDGLIQNPAACDFRPEQHLPRCEPGQSGDSCYTQAQIETLSVLLTAVTDEKGALVQPGYSVSNIQRFFTMKIEESDYTAKEPWPNVENNPPSDPTGGLWSLGNAVIKVFVNSNDPDFHTRSIIDFAEGGKGDITAFRAVAPRKEVNKVLDRAAMGIGHQPKKLKSLLRQDGKLLLWHDLSDEKLTPYMSYNYYKELAKRYGGYGKLQDNVRLFTLPGAAHCGSGNTGVNSFDALTAMENWVEKDEGPNELRAVQFPTNAWGMKDFGKPPVRSLPLCMFPQMARYKGTGDVKDAANWHCEANDTRMLEVGESGKQAGVMQ